MSSSVRVISTVNVNGIRAAVRKGMGSWLAATDADVVCLQETRATDDELRDALAEHLSDGWNLVSAQSEIKGRNGVALLSRSAASAVHIGVGDPDFDDSGRYVQARFGDLTVASVYVPTGEAGTDKQVDKHRFMDSLADHLGRLAEPGEQAVVCGDWNIAHTERDLKNWKSNRTKSGFLPSEREWVSALLAGPWVDVVRALHPDVDGPYSWWSYRGRAFDNDAGWRIDYHLATAELAERADRAAVDRAPTYDSRWSDHAPVTVRYR